MAVGVYVGVTVTELVIEGVTVIVFVGVNVGVGVLDAVIDGVGVGVVQPAGKIASPLLLAVTAVGSALDCVA